MAHAVNALRLNVVELLRHAGASRHVEIELTPEDLGLTDERLRGDVAVDLHATSTIDGIVVAGQVRVGWADQCRRCLVDVSGEVVSDVDEVYQDQPTDDDAVQIFGDHIDLAPLVREYVLLDLPDGPLCRPDCAGICPECGADRNVAPCDCSTEVRDIRWSVLEGLDLDD